LDFGLGNAHLEVISEIDLPSFQLKLVAFSAVLAEPGKSKIQNPKSKIQNPKWFLDRYRNRNHLQIFF
jgi:hypothetical protein